MLGELGGGRLEGGAFWTCFRFLRQLIQHGKQKEGAGAQESLGAVSLRRAVMDTGTRVVQEKPRQEGV